MAPVAAQSMALRWRPRRWREGYICSNRRASKQARNKTVWLTRYARDDFTIIAKRNDMT